MKIGMFYGSNTGFTETGDMVRHYEALFGILPASNGQTFLSFISGTSQAVLVRIDALDELKAWITAHRYVRPPTCEERMQYLIEPHCGAGQQVCHPQRTP